MRRNLMGQPTVVREDPGINFVWTGRPPAEGLTATNFSVRWTGTFIPTQTGTFTFTLRSDDGVRLFLPGGHGPETVFRLAKECGVQVRQIRPGAETLEDVFLRALGHEIQG